VRHRIGVLRQFQRRRHVCIVRLSFLCREGGRDEGGLWGLDGCALEVWRELTRRGFWRNLRCDGSAEDGILRIDEPRDFPELLRDVSRICKWMSLIGRV
jgi:hypothetical protein